VAFTWQRVPDSLPVDSSLADKLSAHAKRQAALAAEIADLEAQNIARKDWTLMGEATARTRPKNSLLEEDLDFERSGGARPASAVTEESTKTLEDIIKARIIEVRIRVVPAFSKLACLTIRGTVSF
jgi:U3 small nucleolar RNA-associated protein MPP10